MRTEKLKIVKHFNNRSPGAASHLHSDKPIQGKNKDKYGLKSLLLKAYPGYLYSSPHTPCKYRYILRLRFRFSETEEHLTLLPALLSVRSRHCLRAAGRCGAERRPPAPHPRPAPPVSHPQPRTADIAPPAAGGSTGTEGRTACPPPTGTERGLPGQSRLPSPA